MHPFRLPVLVLSAALLQTACATAPLVASEQAFAAETAAHGWNAGVRAFAAPDAVVASPLPTNALASLEPADEADVGSPLAWRPALAGIARSRDLGFTTGPYFIHGRGYVGHYFTVWRRDGNAWRWIFDGGVKVLDASPVAAGAAVASLPIAAAKTATKPDALTDVRRLEAVIAEASTTDAARAITARLADDARVNRVALPFASNRRAAQAVLAAATPVIHFELTSATASRAGDLVFTYGRASWSVDGAARMGSYARIWQLRSQGWQIVYDQIVPPP